MSNYSQEGGGIITILNIKKNFRTIAAGFYLALVIIMLSTQVASAYPLQNHANNSLNLNLDLLGLDQANSLAGSANNLLKSVIKVDLLKALTQDQMVKTEVSNTKSLQLLNTKNLSLGDLSGGVKTILTLFVQVIITVLSVVIGILKVVLGLILKV